MRTAASPPAPKRATGTGLGDRGAGLGVGGAGAPPLLFLGMAEGWAPGGRCGQGRQSVPAGLAIWVHPSQTKHRLVHRCGAGSPAAGGGSYAMGVPWRGTAGRPSREARRFAAALRKLSRTAGASVGLVADGLGLSTDVVEGYLHGREIAPVEFITGLSEHLGAHGFVVAQADVDLLCELRRAALKATRFSEAQLVYFGEEIARLWEAASGVRRLPRERRRAEVEDLGLRERAEELKREIEALRRQPGRVEESPPDSYFLGLARLRFEIDKLSRLVEGLPEERFFSRSRPLSRGVPGPVTQVSGVRADGALPPPLSVMSVQGPVLRRRPSARWVTFVLLCPVVTAACGVLGAGLRAALEADDAGLYMICMLMAEVGLLLGCFSVVPKDADGEALTDAPDFVGNSVFLGFVLNHTLFFIGLFAPSWLGPLADWGQHLAQFLS